MVFRKNIILEQPYIRFSEIERIVDFNYQLYFVEGTIIELWKLTEGFGKKAQNAKLAIVLTDKKKLKRLKGKGYVDDILVGYAKKGAIICTQDAELKKRILHERGKVITVRGKTHLVLEE